MLLSAATLVASLLGAMATPLSGATAPAPPPASADISVDLTSTGRTILLPGANFDLSITNNGPDPLTSATVVVQFGVQAGTTPPAPCTFDAVSKLTCAFGALPVGSTAKVSTTVYFRVSGPPMRFSNTATRTTSTPADPNGANDIDTVGCSFLGSSFPPPPIPTLYCG